MSGVRVTVCLWQCMWFSFIFAWIMWLRHCYVYCVLYLQKTFDSLYKTFRCLSCASFTCFLLWKYWAFDGLLNIHWGESKIENTTTFFFVLDEVNCKCKRKDGKGDFEGEFVLWPKLHPRDEWITIPFMKNIHLGCEFGHSLHPKVGSWSTSLGF